VRRAAVGISMKSLGDLFLYFSFPSPPSSFFSRSGSPVFPVKNRPCFFSPLFLASGFLARDHSESYASSLFEVAKTSIWPQGASLSKLFSIELFARSDLEMLGESLLLHDPWTIFVSPQL